MENKLFNIISDESSKDDIRSILEKVNLTKLLKLTRQEATHNSEKVVLVLQAIFQNADLIVNESTSTRFTTYQFCLSLLQQVEIPNTAVSVLVGILLFETDKLSSQNLVQLTSSFLDSVTDGDMFDKWIVIFPKIISTLSLQDVVVHGADNYSGKEFRNHFINSLLNARWQKSSTIHLITVLRDIALEQDELSRTVSKVFSILPELEINELPPVLFQLLQLCSKGERSQVLKGIILFFNTKNTNHEEANNENSFDSEFKPGGLEENFDTVKAVEGTVILHISFAAKQDQDLGKEFVKILKANKFNLNFTLSPFSLALSLAIAKIQVFEEQILDVIKNSIMRSFQVQERKQDFLWIRKFFVSETNAVKSILNTVHYSTYGWDYITDGLVTLGLNLVELLWIKGVHSRNDFASEKSCKLGRDMLIEAFKVHVFIRSSLLEQILDRVINRDVESVANYTDVLSAMVELSPHVFLGSINKVQEAIYCLPFLSHNTALGLLQALMPLLKVSLTLRDALMFTLRKALFNRELKARKVAISGHLLILKSFKVLDGGTTFSQSQSSQSSSISLSQVLVDVHIAKHNKGANEALCLELLSTLQKTLTQQAEARQLLYQSIHHVMRKNPCISGAVLELLLNQFQKYYERCEDIKPPIKLEKCVHIKMDEPILMEPLCNLLHAIQICMCIAEKKAAQDEFFNDEMEGPLSVFKKLSSVMTDLVKRMIECDVEDFELDKTSDFSNSSVGLKNRLYAEQLLGSYEALMEYSFRKDNLTGLLSLFKKYHSLLEIFNEKSGSEKKGDKEKKNDDNEGGTKKKNTKNNKEKRKKNKPLDSILSLDVLSNLLWSLFCNSSTGDSDSFEPLRNDDSFLNYLVRTASHCALLYKEKTSSLQNECEKNASHFGLIARALIKQYWLEKEGPSGNGTQTQQGHRSNAKQAKGQRNLAHGLDCLANLVNLYCKQNTRHLHIFLLALKSGQPITAAAVDHSLFQDTLRAIIRKFQKMVFSILSETDDKHLKDVVPLLIVLKVLSEQLQDGYDEDLYKWITQLCKQQNINDIPVGCALLNLSFDLCHKNKSCVSYYEDVAGAIHKILGDIEEDVTVDREVEFGVVNQVTAVSVGILVVQQLDGLINQFSWVLDQLRADSSANIGVPSDQSSRSKNEKEICSLLAYWVTACQPILQTAWPVGSLILSILRLMSHFFNFLAAFAKYEIALYAERTGHMSSYFEKIVKLCAVHLTPKVYSFITYTEAVEREKHVKGKQKSESGKFQKENKTVPLLICAIEQYERCLLTLSKKSKVNLTDHLKRSTARDFRINAEAVQNALKGNDASDEENTVPNEESDEGEPSSHRNIEHVSQAVTEARSQRPPTAKRGRRKLGSKS